ncbi:type II toxin-antitoxin system RelE/ParE family toxin [Jiella avicenniae]|uniref:Type II toxin-antitoxin system RelE/ParE family toxin n=1 Tax=Jiella avicenniae TaxID=2907202 RepID=A0A9X1T3C3_9HYPH|nr:type II toxin-antitoxin system RelE/ParE family toxin [Jiella avicenniae]MCE7027341.1 type II toxin-antitoxin system RelE/ParE family toxin [Jiella avicenniae]
MKRVEVIYRPEALADLNEILEAVAQLSQSSLVAERYVDRIVLRCRKIGDAPRGGRRRDELEVGLRSVPFEDKALILYRVTDVVEITNIFPRGQNYEVLFKKGRFDPE